MDILGLIIFIGFVILRAVSETKRKQQQTSRPQADARPVPDRPPVTTRPVPGRPVWPQAPTGPFGGPMLPRPGRSMFPVPLPWELPEEDLPPGELMQPQGAAASARASIPTEGEGEEGAYKTMQGKRLSGVGLGEGEGSEGQGEGEGTGLMEGEPRRRRSQPLPGPLTRPAQPGPALFATGLTRNDILRGVIMAEILASPLSRRPRAVQPVPGASRSF